MTEEATWISLFIAKTSVNISINQKHPGSVYCYCYIFLILATKFPMRWAPMHKKSLYFYGYYLCWSCVFPNSSLKVYIRLNMSLEENKWLHSPVLFSVQRTQSSKMFPLYKLLYLVNRKWWKIVSKYKGWKIYKGGQTIDYW